MVNGMNDINSEDDFKDEEFVAKRIKISNIDICNSSINGKKEQILDVHAVDGHAIASAESMGGNGSNVGEKVLGRIGRKIPESIKILQETTTGEVQDQLVGTLYNIDVAAAEDKGSRHKMEDAWVVLPDASLEYPGSSRCAHFAIYDGHGGRLAAEYAQKHLHANVLSAGLPH